MVNSSCNSIPTKDSDSPDQRKPNFIKVCAKNPSIESLTDENEFNKIKPKKL